MIRPVLASVQNPPVAPNSLPAFGGLLDRDALPLALLGVLALEALALLWWRHRTGRGPASAPTLTFLGAGAGFAAALLFHRRAGGAAGFALAMLLALGMHLWHLQQLARLSRASHDQD